MSSIKLYLIKYEIPALNRLGIATVAASSPKQAQDYLQAQGKYNGYKYDMNYPTLVHTTDTWTAATIISEIDNPIGEKGDIGPQGPKGDKGDRGEKGDPGDPMTWEKMDPEDKMTFKEDAVADVESAIKTKYYPSMSVGMADNLVGRGDVQDAQISFRPSAGADNITDGAARIERIKGNSVVYNQLVKNADFRNGGDKWSPTLFTFSQENDYVVLETTAKGNQQITQTFAEKIPANHKILIICDNQRLTNTSLPFMFYLRKTGVSEFDTSIIPAYSSTQRRNISTIINTTAEIDSIRVYPIQQAEAGTKVNMYSIRIIDLTQMFNVGNEPTSYEEYLQRKPMNIEDEYEHNAGELVDMKVDRLISTSDNVYNPLTHKARVLGGKKYDITTSTGEIPRVEFENDKGEIGAEFEKVEGKYVFSTDGYLTFANTDELGDICVCLSYSYPKPHPPYQQNVKDLSFISEAFSDGMRSAGSAYDEIRFNPTKKVWEKVTRIGVAANLTFISGGENLFAVSIADSKWPETPVERTKTIFSNKYAVSKNVTASLMDDKSMLQLPQKNNIYIKDTAYATVAAFNEANQDLVIYYELAEPDVEEIDYPTAETNMDYLVWDFGTEEAIASVPSAPFRAGINYEPNAVDDLRWCISHVREIKEWIEANKTQTTNIE